MTPEENVQRLERIESAALRWLRVSSESDRQAACDHLAETLEECASDAAVMREVMRERSGSRNIEKGGA